MPTAAEVGLTCLKEVTAGRPRASLSSLTSCQAMETVGVYVPLMLSVTVSDIGGRTLSGQTLDAFLASVQHADIFSVGLNCSFGARQLKPFLKQLAARAPYYISAYPNAGLPNSNRIISFSSL